MALPETVRVKLSTEAAEAISITPVVVREIPLRELVEHMLGVTGKDEGRIRELLLRGTLVSGASRFRWTGWEAEGEAVRMLLETFPDADPSRPFAPERCVRAVLRGGRQAIEVPRAAGQKKPLFRRISFWELLMEVVAAAEIRYTEYSYKDRADSYHVDFCVSAAERLRAGSRMVKYTTLSEQIRTVAFAGADLYVERH